MTTLTLKIPELMAAISARNRNHPWVNQRLQQIGFSLKHDVGSVCKLMKKYADLPMSLADACLVRMSEIHDGSKVFTLDGSFRIYKRNGRQAIPLVFPGQG